MFASIRLSVSITALAICVGYLTISADCSEPKVKQASHEVIDDDVAEETTSRTVTSKADTLSYSPRWPEPPNTGAMLMRLGFGTVAVLALCVGTLWFGKPWLQRLQISGGISSGMTVEGSVALGNRARLYLVRVGDTQLVAGTDALGLKSLIAIPPSFKEVLEDQVPADETINSPSTAVAESEERS